MLQVFVHNREGKPLMKEAAQTADRIPEGAFQLMPLQRCRL
jgi:hypothetical protein